MDQMTVAEWVPCTQLKTNVLYLFLYNHWKFKKNLFLSIFHKDYDFFKDFSCWQAELGSEWEENKAKLVCEQLLFHLRGAKRLAQTHASVARYLQSGYER